MARAKDSILVVVKDPRATDLIARHIIPAQVPSVGAVSTSSSTPADIMTNSFSSQIAAQRMAGPSDAIDFLLE